MGQPDAPCDSALERLQAGAHGEPWRPKDLGDRLALELETDALAAPQGRAEDVSLRGVYRLSDRVELDLGYRLLEGGADNDEVYTFSFFHYAVAGVRVRF